MTVAEMEAAIESLEREMKAPPRGLQHTLDNGRCTSPDCSSCTRRTR